MRLEDGGYMMRSGEESEKSTMFPMWPGQKFPETYQEAKDKLIWTISQLVKQYIEDNGLEQTKRLMEWAQEQYPELPHEGWEYSIFWAEEAVNLTNLRNGLQEAVEHPERLEKMNPDELENLDLYGLIAETMP